MQKQQKAKISAEDFVRTWQASSSLDAVAKTTKLSAMSARQRASNYRKKGIKLQVFPSMRGRGLALDVTALKRLAASLAPTEKKVMANKTAKRK